MILVFSCSSVVRNHTNTLVFQITVKIDLWRYFIGKLRVIDKEGRDIDIERFLLISDIRFRN